jgi:hypothetical protein
MAPTAILSAIFFIVSVPGSCLLTQEERQKVKPRAMIPKIGMITKRVFMSAVVTVGVCKA